ncbi:MAG TPA: chemotaxis protein CheB, partial [Myxococcaceae bacterium]|nr:chemotaxis protein CheB [Myxococcaceae bacterium]
MSEPNDPAGAGGGEAQDRAATARVGDDARASTAAEERLAAVSRGGAEGFGVVGVGASAGGVEALDAFFAGLQQTGMAFVVVQHMATDKQSHLPEILSRVTRMPVVQATDGLAIEPDHVYVVPPGSNLALFEGTLHLIELPSGGTHSSVLPIDFFFQSLAAECGPRCIGVILSGTGVDGMRGLQHIREAGGLTFAQDPSTARFPGMPSAAAAGADAVLSPEGIGHELIRMSRHP